MMILFFGALGIVFLTIFPLSLYMQQRMALVATGRPELTPIFLGFAVLSLLLNLTGNICLTRAYMTTNSSLLIGMTLIATAGIITAWREQRAARKSVT